jgi:hypothetical protein
VDAAEFDLSIESGEGGSERRHVLRRFWASFIARAKAKTTMYAKRSATADHWLSAGVGRTGFSLNVSLAKDWSRVACFFRLPDDPNQQKTINAFKQLEAQKQRIEKAFGGPLNWESLPERLGSRVRVDVKGGWKLPESDWPDFQDELIEKSVRLADAMRSPIQELQI